MNSIRPLVTITILTIVAVFLFMKINQGPVRPVANGGASATQTPDGVPALDAVSASPTSVPEGAPTAESAAPAWPSAAPNADPIAHSADVAPVNVPAVPAIPELPGMSSSSELADRTSLTTPAELPANIPVAQYPGEISAGAVDATGDRTAAEMNATAERSESTTTDANAHATDSAMAAVGLMPRPDVATIPPVGTPGTPASSTSATDEINSNAAAASNPVTPPAGTPDVTPVESSLGASWPVIEAALERGELARAHQLLSQWYGEPSLTPAEKERVDTLLSQLAGTVVYSTEHQLEPAHVVQAGETLETIAAKYNVPWQLLAKINGAAAADAVQPGQQLKVMRGPFSAVVDLTKNELTLMLDGRYAGRFAVTATSQTVQEGEWVVEGKPQAASRHLVLRKTDATSAEFGTPVIIGSTPTVEPTYQQIGQNGQSTENAMPYLKVSPGDADELSDILSVGSRVVVRR